MSTGTSNYNLMCFNTNNWSIWCLLNATMQVINYQFCIIYIVETYYFGTLKCIKYISKYWKLEAEGTYNCTCNFKFQSNLNIIFQNII